MRVAEEICERSGFIGRARESIRYYVLGGWVGSSGLGGPSGEVRWM